MHDDLLDAVDWARRRRRSPTADKICIMGGSYGGYATLVGLTFTPDVFACGVDIVGPSNIVTLLDTDPAVLGADRVACSTPASATRDTAGGQGRAARRVSPLTHVDKIKRPLLIGQGANDPRVKQAESDQIVDGDARQEHPGHLRAVPRRGPRLRAPGEQHRVLRASPRRSSRRTSAAGSSRSRPRS